MELDADVWSGKRSGVLGPTKLESMASHSIRLSSLHHEADFQQENDGGKTTATSMAMGHGLWFVLPRDRYGNESVVGSKLHGDR